MKKIMMMAAVALTVVACHSKEKKNDEVTTAPAPTSKPQTDAVAKATAENSDTFVTELTFDKGSTTLSDAQKRRLAALIARAQEVGKIDEIKVVTWSDMEYPSPSAKKLSKDQRDLADRRNNAVEDYIDSVADSDVDTYNMASRPGALSRLMRTDNARIKRSLEVAGIPTTDSYMKVPAKASKSIVMLVME